MTEPFLEHFGPVTTERAPFLLLNFQVSTPKTFCSSPQIPCIYISQKAPESYKYIIRSLGERWGEREGKELHGDTMEPRGFHVSFCNFQS